MPKITVNGKEYQAPTGMKLMRFLRDELRLTSVKDGCSEGACGTCTVLIDGAAKRACIPVTDRLEGKSIVTVEGLTEWEQRVYTYAFGKAGAVQCGFCIPGMVLCAKALLDGNPEPSEEEIRLAIKNNYCRCTGYVKIIKAISLAAEIFRTGLLPGEIEEDWRIGSGVMRLDVREKVLGTGIFTDDLYPEGMLYGSALRSAHPRARVLAIRTQKAKAIPGVFCILTAEDIPGENRIGHIVHDQYTLIPVGEITHYLGDSIALIAAKSREALEAARACIEVDYEVLPAVHNPQEAAACDAPAVFEGRENNVQAHRFVARGDAPGAIAGAKYVISGHFETPWTEHAFLEPECAVAQPMDDGILLLTSDQSAHTTMRECALMLGLPTERVRVQNQLVGGGFGGKEDMSVQHHAALLAWHTKCPVKVKLTRAESILVHPKRHPFSMDFTLGCDERGIIQGVQASCTSDTGAFASLGGPVLERACTHAAGPYDYQNFRIEGNAYYTNNPPAGAFRGFGVTQSCFAMESLLNMMAEKIGISPWEIRMRNAIRPGGVLPNGQIVDDSTGLVETLEAIKPYYDEAIAQGDCVGLACAMKNAGVGVGLPDWGRCKLRIEADGKVHIYAGASCIGQGIGTVLVQMVVSNTPLDRADIVYERSNTWIAPDSGDTSGSRQTLVTGEACRRACEKLCRALEGGALTDLIGQDFDGAYLAKTDPLGAPIPNPVSHVAYGYATQLCVVDRNTGKIKRIVAAHEVGKAINPLSCEGQIEGGVVMSMGYALREQYPIDGNCRPTAKFGTLGLFRADEVPEIVSLVLDKPGVPVACGAIGIGEITSIPTAPAIADAYYHYDGLRRSSLPLEHTPYARKTGQKKA